MKKKYLLYDNKEFADKRISLINEIMVNPINNLISTIKKAGATIDSIKDLERIFKNGFQAIEAMIPQNDLEGIPASLIPMVEKEHQDKIGAIWNAFSAIEKFPNDMSLSMLEISASGLVEISDSVRTKIEEENKEYITTTIGCELYEIQHELADLMQKFHDKLQKAMNIPGKTMSLDVKATLYTLFPLGAFTFKRNEDDCIRVTPKTINFDPINIED